MKPVFLLVVTRTVFFFSILAAAHGQTIYNNNGTIPGDWIDADNWSTGVPISTSAVEIGVQPTGGILNMAGAGDGSGTVTMASLDFSASLGGDVDFMGTGTEMLEVNGAISNSSAFNVTFSIPVLSVASAVWSGPMLFQDLVMVDTKTITLTGTAIFAATLDFNIVDAVTFGRLSDSGSAMFFGTITVGGSYTGNLGDTFDLTSQSFSGATLGWLPDLDPGLTWDSSNFLTDGTLTVVPEPTTGLLISVGLTALLACSAAQKKKNCSGSCNKPPGGGFGDGGQREVDIVAIDAE
jgi:hypothetical protein